MILIIVGNKFLEFAKQDNIITVSDFLTNISSQPENYLSKFKELYICQGVNFDQHQLIKEKLQTHKGTSLLCLTELTNKELSSYVHKHADENVIITQPKLISDLKFLSKLSVDDRCEILNDHVTGLHLQGMLIIEASRQMMLSISERFFPCKLISDNRRFSLINTQSNFHQFILPLDVSIEAEMSIIQHTEKRLEAEISCRFTQQNTNCAHVSIRFSASSEKTILHKEQKLSRSALLKLLKKQP